MSNFLSFSCDYMEGAHPQILKRLMETNLVKTPGYGLDDYSKSAKEKIRDACKAPDAEVFFLVGGTQTNVTMIDAILKSYEGVIAADTGHVSVHEAGAIEFGGHKVLTLPHHNGKINVRQIETLLDDYQNDANRDQMVKTGMVYLSHPTEYGTLYSKAELREISALCRLRNIPLYLDGARLAYALACPQNEITLADIAELCDAFYIGGTKCGALFGEAVVIPKAGWLPHLFTIIKQHGALLAKGRMLGIQFDELFTDYLYGRVGVPAIQAADRIRQMLIQKGYTLCFDSPTNQVFCIIENTEMEQLAEKVEFGFWEKYDDSHTIIRFATSWATKMEDVEALCTVL